MADQTHKMLEEEADRAEREDSREESERSYVKPRPPKAPSQVYSIRIPVERLEQLRSVAERREEPPTALIRDWVLERLDTEDEAPVITVRIALPVYEDALRAAGESGLTLEAFAQQAIAHVAAKQVTENRVRWPPK